MSTEKDLQNSLDKASGKKAKPAPPPPSATKPVGIVNPAKKFIPTPVTQVAEIKDGFEPEHQVAYKLAFIGTGQGGGKIAQSHWDLGYRRVCVFNTTENDFDGLHEDICRMSTRTNGAAKDMELARTAIRHHDQEFWDLFTRAWGTDIDYALVCASLGGGTGSGTVLPIAMMARKYLESKGRAPKVGAILSLPRINEGQQTCKNALRAFNELTAAKISPLIIMDNDRITSLFPVGMGKLYSTANGLVSSLFHLFNRLAATKSTFTTFDAAELGQLLDHGIVTMGSVDMNPDNLKSPADVSTAIRDDLAKSVLAQVDLRTGKKAACIFVADDGVMDNLPATYFDAGYEQLNRLLGSALPEGTEIVVHRGLYLGSETGLQCYTMISDLASPDDKLKALAKEGGVRDFTSAMAKHLRVE